MTPPPEPAAPEAGNGDDDNKPQHEPFELAVGFVLKDEIEGGYVNDPRDPGGETNFGISKRAYPRLDIASLNQEEAIAIYRRDYWEPAGCDDLPLKLAIAVFDTAVNQGVGIAKKLLQKALRVADDGVIGPVTIGAACSGDQDEHLGELLSWRLRRYAHTANSVTFMRGWSKRVLTLQRFLDTLEVA